MTVPLAADRETQGQAPADKVDEGPRGRGGQRRSPRADCAGVEGSTSIPSFACPACAGEFEAPGLLSDFH